MQRPLGLLPPGNRHLHGRKPGRVSPGPSRRRRPLTWRVPPLRAACTTLRGSCVSSVPPGSSATPRWEPRRTASPAPALTPTRTTSELCPLTGPGFNPPLPPPVNLPLVLQVLPDLREPWERRLPVHGVPARLHGPVLRTVRLIFSPALLTPLSWCLPSPPPLSCALGYVGNPQDRVKCRLYDGEKVPLTCAATSSR